MKLDRLSKDYAASGGHFLISIGVSSLEHAANDNTSR